MPDGYDIYQANSNSKTDKEEIHSLKKIVDVKQQQQHYKGKRGK